MVFCKTRKRKRIQSTFFTTAILPFALLIFIPKWYYKEEMNTKNPQQSFMEYKPCLWSLNYGAQQAYEDKYKNYFDIATWCKTNTPKDAIVCCRKPGLFYLFADRHVIIEKGRVVWNGSTAALTSDPVLKDRYLHI